MVFNANNPITIMAGKTIPVKSPIFRLKESAITPEI